MNRWLWSVLAVLLFAGAAAAGAPPAIDAAPLFNAALIAGHWQPLEITLDNPASGDAFQGEVQVSVEASRSGVRQASYTTPVTLPKGAGTTRAVVYVYVVQGGLPEFTVYVVQGRGGAGAPVTCRRFTRIPILDQTVGLAAVSQTPDALSYLQGEMLGVYSSGGALRPAAAAGDPNKPGNYARQQQAQRPVRLSHLADAGRLPDRAIGYDTLGIIYLGQDVTPDGFSDTQVAALRGWVSSGGLLVTAGTKLRSDERFRSWLPAPANGDTPSFRRIGGGTVTAIGLDAAALPFAGSPAALSFWKQLAHRGIAPRSLGQTLVSGSDNYQYYNYASAVLHAPGLNAPGYGAIGLFLLLYLLLLVPLNYVILKRLDKREWSWITIPALVVLFSVSAYGFGYATKGTALLVNTASIIEMGTGTGDAAAHTIIGVFSPARRQYQVQIGGDDSLAWAPRVGYYGPDTEYGPLIVSEPTNAGAVIRDAEISMWAMRTFATRTNTLRFGDGIVANLSVNGGQIAGSITNRTGNTLEKARVSYHGYGQELGSLKTGQTVKVRFAIRGNAQIAGSPVRAGRYSTTRSAYLSSATASSNYSGGPLKTSEQVRGAIEAEVAESVSNVFRAEQNSSRSLTLTAWNYDPLLPVQINGETVTGGVNVNLLLFTLPPLSSSK